MLCIHFPLATKHLRQDDISSFGPVARQDIVAGSMEWSKSAHHMVVRKYGGG